MTLFIIGVLATVASLVVIVRAKAIEVAGFNTVRYRDGSTEPKASRNIFRSAALMVLVIIGIPLIMVSCFTITDARSVGVKTSFNQESGTVGPGLSLKEPQEKVEEWTTRNQVVEFRKGAKDEDEDDNFHVYGCVTVRLGNQSDGCIEATITFAVTEKNVTTLWAQHKTFKAAVREAVVPQARTAVDFVFSGWNPVGGIEKGLENVQTRTNKEWSALLKPQVTSLYDLKSLKLVDAAVTFVHLDDRTREQLNQISAQQAATQVAKEKINTAQAEADALAKRKAAASTCVDLYLYLASTDQLKNVNAGFNCGASSGTLVNGGPR